MFVLTFMQGEINFFGDLRVTMLKVFIVRTLTQNNFLISFVLAPSLKEQKLWMGHKTPCHNHPTQLYNFLRNKQQMQNLPLALRK